MCKLRFKVKQNKTKQKAVVSGLFFRQPGDWSSQGDIAGQKDDKQGEKETF